MGGVVHPRIAFVLWFLPTTSFANCYYYFVILGVLLLFGLLPIVIKIPQQVPEWMFGKRSGWIYIRMHLHLCKKCKHTRAYVWFIHIYTYALNIADSMIDTCHFNLCFFYVFLLLFTLLFIIRSIIKIHFCHDYYWDDVHGCTHACTHAYIHMKYIRISITFMKYIHMSYII